MSMENPSAFPQLLAVDGPFGGMTLRDWFAGQALAGLLANDIDGPDGKTIGGHQDHYAAVSYGYAEAMLLARARTGLEAEQAAPGTGEKLLTIAREFIDKHHVSCAEATTNDGVYEEAPLLVEQLAEVAGYYSYPEGE